MINNSENGNYIKKELKDFVRSRYTNWGFIAVAAFSVLAYILVMIFVPYLSIEGANGLKVPDGPTLTFGNLMLGYGRTSVLRPNWFFIGEFLVFVIAVILPIFAKKHIKGMLLVSSIMLILDTAVCIFNWSNWVIELSFQKSTWASLMYTTPGAHLSYAYEALAGFFIIAALPAVVAIIEWICLLASDTVCKKKLVEDVKHGKKLANY